MAARCAWSKHTDPSQNVFWKNNYLNIYGTGSLSEPTVYRVQSAFLSGLSLILIALTGWMKLVSYAHTNSDIRALVQAGEKVGLMWLQN